MIPKNIEREHIIKAIEEMDKTGIPKARGSRKFVLRYKGKQYPPKYVVSLANKYANGTELDPSEFSGGDETNSFIKALGFKILKLARGKLASESSEKAKGGFREAKHDERCPKCKETIRRLLEKIYGEVEPNFRFEVGTYPEDFADTPWYGKLKEIYEALRSYRGFKDFVKAKTLPNCDFFLPSQQLIVEFDETQHFTEPRRIALEKYPEDIKLGFDKEKWIELCGKIKAKDNNPPYRDEQRAWYDTLRDFLPAIKGLKPTVRLFSKDYVWCSLDPSNPSDVKKFETILKGAAGDWEVEVKEEPNPSMARVIICGEWRGNPTEVKRLLEDIREKWPEGRKVKFLVTCGGFIQFDWPESISRKDIGDNRNPSNDIIVKLVAEAGKHVNSILSGDLCRKLGEVADYITLGVDSFKEKISTTRNYISQLHVELVFLKDLRRGSLHWTGKSYPTPAQQKGLIRITDLKTHFLNTDAGKVMILGCHDLNVFNPRSKNAKGWRRKVNEDFKKLAGEEKPLYVLHHPHTTVKRRTWLNAWNGLRKTLPSVKEYASSGRYCEPA